MNDTPLEQIMPCVDWQGIEEHLAKSGKVKAVLRGIPGDRFWRQWKRLKPALKDYSVTVYPVSRTKTGEVKTHKGITREIVRKQWEVSVWLNRHNRPVLAQAGFPVYGEETEREVDQPF